MLYKQYIKPLFDIILSIILFTVSLPIFISISIILLINNRGKLFFIQPRTGIDEKEFNIIKFKTMTDKTDADGNLLSDENRLTKIGMLIRKYSLDEIPQLLNILKGEMSLIGPRPMIIDYLPLYSDEQKRRHEVKPGITGWAQVNGRNAINWEEKFRLDVWYVENVAFLVDIKILLFTVIKTLKSEGISSPTSSTMESFKGNS